VDDVELQDSALACDRTFGESGVMRYRNTYRGDGRDAIHQEIIVHGGQIGTAALDELEGGLDIQAQCFGALDSTDDLLRFLLDDSRLTRRMVLDRVGTLNARGRGDINQSHISGQWGISAVVQELLVAVLEVSHDD